MMHKLASILSCLCYSAHAMAHTGDHSMMLETRAFNLSFFLTTPQYEIWYELTGTFDYGTEHSLTIWTWPLGSFKCGNFTLPIVLDMPMWFNDDDTFSSVREWPIFPTVVEVFGPAIFGEGTTLIIPSLVYNQTAETLAYDIVPQYPQNDRTLKPDPDVTIVKEAGVFTYDRIPEENYLVCPPPGRRI